MWQQKKDNEAPAHLVYGYDFNGEYCGDFEISVDDFPDAYGNHDFSKIIKKHPANTFIPYPLPDCNPLYQATGVDMTLAHCDDDNGVGGGYNPPEDDSDCLDNANCHRPCHKKFLKTNGECTKFAGKYNPTDYSDT